MGACKKLASLLLVHTNNNVFIEGDFYGTLVSYDHNVSIGQTTKHFWGAVMAENTQVHQDTKFYYVPLRTWKEQMQNYWEIWNNKPESECFNGGCSEFY